MTCFGTPDDSEPTAASCSSARGPAKRGRPPGKGAARKKSATGLVQSSLILDKPSLSTTQINSKGLPCLKEPAAKPVANSNWVTEQFVHTRLVTTYDHEEGEEHVTEQPIDEPNRVRCIHCNTILSNLNVTHMKHHLLGSKCRFTTSQQFSDLGPVASKELRERVLVKKHATPGMIQHVSISKTAKAELDMMLLQLLVAQALPFTLVLSPKFQAFCKRLNPSYHPPTPKYLAVQLLDKQVAQILQWQSSQLVDDTLPYVGMAADGWSRGLSEQHLTGVTVGWPGTSMLLDCFVKESLKETGDDVAATIYNLLKQHQLLTEVVDGDGEPQWQCKVAGITTDTPSVMKSFKSKLQLLPGCEKVFSNDCAAHVLDLFLEDITKNVPAIHEAVSDGQSVTLFFSSSSKVLALLRQTAAANDEFTQKRNGVQAALRRPGATRFHTSQIAAQSRLDHKAVLVATVASPRFQDVTQALKDDNVAVVQALVRSTKFWLAQRALVDLMTPFSAAIEDLGGAAATLADEARWVLKLDKHIQSMRDQNLLFSKDAHPYVIRQWDMRRGQLLTGQAWLALLTDPHPDSRKFVQVCQDELLSFRDTSRWSSIEDCVYSFLCSLYKQEAALACRTLLLDSWLSPTKIMQLGFSTVQLDEYAKADAAAQWWKKYGAKFKVLQDVSMRVLSVSPCATACERVNSAFKGMWSDTRSSMHVKRVAKLVYCKVNLPLIDDSAVTEADWDAMLACLAVNSDVKLVGAPLVVAEDECCDGADDAAETEDAVSAELAYLSSVGI